MLNRILGNASEVEAKKLQKDLQHVLGEGETVAYAYKLIRDFFVFTERRLLLVDKQGMTGRKVEYHSIPYKSISSFSVETAGNFDMDAEMKIWLSGRSTPIEKKFKRGTDVVIGVQKALAEFVR